jgi:type III restriction enzyme
VSGGRKLAGPTKAKAETARQWCQAVNNHGGYGHWGYTEITDMAYAESNLNNAITSLYGDGPGAGELD